MIPGISMAVITLSTLVGCFVLIREGEKNDDDRFIAGILGLFVSLLLACITVMAFFPGEVC